MKLSDFSPLQQQAILHKEGNVLISAGAGSGKTAVLIQRLYELIKNGDARLDQLLVLTFTNFAAKELKIRLKDKLSEDDATKGLANLVESSDITTFDAFALKIVKKYSYILDINPSISIFDQGLYKIKRRQEIESTLANYYDVGDERLTNFIRDYLKNNDKNLVALVEEFDNQVNLEIDAEKYVNDFVNNHYSKTRFNELIEEYTRLIYDELQGIFELIELINHDEVRAIYEEWTLNFSSLSTYQDYYQVISTLALPKVGNKVKKVEYSDDLNLLKQIIKAIKTTFKLVEVGTVEDINNIFEREKKVATFIIELYNTMKEKLDHFKHLHNVYTFADVARLAYKIVSNHELNEIIAQNYKFILVDEYQDTSDIQEYFVQKIARNNVYMVGDIKQSIYGFRNANPKIFQAKFQKYKQSQGGTLLNLVDNYRSRRQIVDGVNSMLNKIMTLDFGGADYKKDHQIGFGNKDYDKVEIASQDYQLEVFNYQKNPKLNNDRIEAYIVGQDIISKINQGFLVYDKKIKKHRKVMFSDFTILCRKRKMLDDFIRIFNELQIPLFTADNADAKEARVVQTLFSAIKLYNTIIKDDFGDDFKTSFISFARSFVNNIDDQTIYDYLMNDKQAFKTSEIYQKMVTIKNQLGDSAPSLIVEKIIDSFAINKKLISLGDIDNNRQTLVTILKMIENLESYGMDFSALIEHFEYYYKNEEKIEVAASESIDNAVKIMTIHTSKGLEFPLVYLIGFYSGFNFNSLHSSFKVSAKYGLILPTGKINEAKSIAYNLNFYANKIELISEEIRLLYVALTRAEEKMMALAPVSEKEYITRQISAKSNLDLLGLTKYYQERLVAKQLGTIEKAPSIDNSAIHHFSLAKISLPLVVKDQQRASKKVTLFDTKLQEVLKVGRQYHRYLEIVNLASKDTSFINDKEKRQKIDKVLALDLFNSVNEENVYKEYRFYDNTKDSEAIIDLFIVRDDYIDLIDYKLAATEDEKYQLQLEHYANFLLNSFHRPVRIYLLSIMKVNYNYIKQVG